MSRHEFIKMFDLIMRALLILIFNQRNEVKMLLFDEYNEFMEELEFKSR